MIFGRVGEVIVTSVGGGIHSEGEINSGVNSTAINMTLAVHINPRGAISSKIS